MKRLASTFGIVATTTVLSVGVAAAAALGAGTGKLSAGNAAVAGCTSSALTATRNVNNSGNVTRVNVLNVPQTCAGETLAVTLESTGGSNLATSSATVGTCSGGCTVVITGLGTVPAASVNAFALSLTQ